MVSLEFGVFCARLPKAGLRRNRGKSSSPSLEASTLGDNAARLCQVIMGDCCSWNGCVLRISEKRKGYFVFKC